ncbi:MAG TPA: hypothetical protein VJS44_09905 [Pyrinomonadaceae bacterium]|nr:hypothetical protein [Pyrinomonadaceae bacterium]
MPRYQRRASLSGFIFCLVIIYSLMLSGIAPFTLTKVKAEAEAKVEKGASLGASKQLRGAGGKRAGELLVRFRENVSNEDKNALAASKSARREKMLRGESRVEKLKLQEGQDIDALAAEVRLNPAVELVEPNYLIGKDEVTPNDPRFIEQWALKNTGSSGGAFGADIGASEAWRLPRAGRKVSPCR